MEKKPKEKHPGICESNSMVYRRRTKALSSEDVKHFSRNMKALGRAIGVISQPCVIENNGHVLLEWGEELSRIISDQVRTLALFEHLEENGNATSQTRVDEPRGYRKLQVFSSGPKENLECWSGNIEALAAIIRALSKYSGVEDQEDVLLEFGDSFGSMIADYSELIFSEHYKWNIAAKSSSQVGSGEEAKAENHEP
jgi:hypothetical protein